MPQIAGQGMGEVQIVEMVVVGVDMRLSSVTRKTRLA
jgi:hypothetical protein